MKKTRFEPLEIEIIKMLDAEARLRDEERRDGFHVTELLGCLRRAYYKRMNVARGTNKYEREQLLLFTAGRAHHEMIELVGEPNYKGVFSDDIHYSVDVLLDDGSPLEIKSTAAQGEREYIYDKWVEQLLAYCAVLNRRVGYLLVFRLVYPGKFKRSGKPKRGAEIFAYKYTFTGLELNSMRSYLVARRGDLMYAIKNKVPPSPDEVWECSECDCYETL